MIVVDASAVLDLLLRSERADRLELILLTGRDALHAPHLLDVEVVGVLRRLLNRSEIPESRAREALADFSALPIERHAHDILLPRMLDLHANVTAYDAAYIALAEGLDARVVTCDAKLAASSGHAVPIDLVD